MTLYPQGVSPEQFKPGTLLACHGESFVSGAIRFGQRLRVEKQYCWANHIACVLSTDGMVMEMLGKGAAVSNAAEKYHEKDYVVIDAGLTLRDTRRAISVWQDIWECHTDYGFTEIASIVPSLMTGTHLRFFAQGQLICSGAAAVGLAATGARIPLSWREDPAFVLPAQFMQLWKVPPPEVLKGTSVG